MTLGPGAFAAILWGAVALVLAVFAYEVYALAADLRRLGGPRRPGGSQGARE